MDFYLFLPAICRRCREHIGKIIASREGSAEPFERGASPLVTHQLPPSQVVEGPPTEVVEPKSEAAELPLVLVFLWMFCKSLYFPYLHAVFNRHMYVFNRKKMKVVPRI